MKCTYHADSCIRHIQEYMYMCSYSPGCYMSIHVHMGYWNTHQYLVEISGKYI